MIFHKLQISRKIYSKKTSDLSNNSNKNNEDNKNQLKLILVFSYLQEMYFNRPFHTRWIMHAIKASIHSAETYTVLYTMLLRSAYCNPQLYDMQTWKNLCWAKTSTKKNKENIDIQSYQRHSVTAWFTQAYISRKSLSRISHQK